MISIIPFDSAITLLNLCDNRDVLKKTFFNIRYLRSIAITDIGRLNCSMTLLGHNNQHYF